TSADTVESIKVIAKRYAKAYNEDLQKLAVLKPYIEPYATEHLDEMVTMIQKLIEQGHAYEADGHVLFDVTSFDEYGSLSKRNLEDMLAGARVEVASYKKHPGDFVLWKPSDDNLPGWSSPWGRGRPGWHIECSAMAAKHLGKTIDIRCGGKDLIFPHHENEIAQSCCANQTKRFAHYWLHNGFITMSEQKMSKSLGNIALIRDVLTQHKGEVIRWLLLGAQYRQSVDWSEDSIKQAQRTLDRIYASLRSNQNIAIDNTIDIDPELLAALEDDLNTPVAFARLNHLAKNLAKAQSNAEKSLYKSSLLKSANMLGLLQQDPERWFADEKELSDELKQKIEALIGKRDQARLDKNWSESDRLRDELAALGVRIEDSKDGTRWSMK
ncbi:MAG: cysteine--tRNA ligase, partial [Proteobacteria bacterium]|nr:cysteine--tRNA ligase [Pseudomonadota bacterium]